MESKKIKPCAFPIHACIDGFSRKVIWLKVARTGNNPVILANYFLKAVASLQVLPERLRSDSGHQIKQVKTFGRTTESFKEGFL